MADKNLKVVISAEDNTKKGIKSAESNMGSLGGVAKKLGGVLAGAFAVGAIVSFGKATFEAFKESEAAMARFNTTMKTMGTAGEKARDQLLKTADAALKLAFDDEEAAESLAKLFQRTGDVTEATKLNAIAMDLARAKQISLTDATNLLGQVMSGNGRVLKQYGIELDETKTPLQAIDELQKKVAGSAEAYANTTAGSVEKLSLAWGNLKENIGGVVAQALTPLIDMTANLIANLPSMDELGAKFSSFFAMIDEKTGLITLMKDAWAQIVETFNTSLKPALDELMVALQPYMPFLQALAKVFGVILVVAIAGFVKAVQGLIMLAAEILAVWIKVQTFMLEKLGPVFEWIGDKIAKVTETVIRLIDKLKQLDVIGGLKNSVSKIFGGGRAVGGPVTGNRPYLVGENGPEIFTPQGYGRITPNNKLGASLVINITGNSFMGKEGIAREIGEEILRQVSYRTKLTT